MFRGGSMVGYLDPVVLISAMGGGVTKSVAFRVTGRMSYICISPSFHLDSLIIFCIFLFFIVIFWYVLLIDGCYVAPFILMRT